jgi:hypothetical protein
MPESQAKYKCMYKKKKIIVYKYDLLRNYRDVEYYYHITVSHLLGFVSLVKENSTVIVCIVFVFECDSRYMSY